MAAKRCKTCIAICPRIGSVPFHRNNREDHMAEETGNAAREGERERGDERERERELDTQTHGDRGG